MGSEIKDFESLVGDLKAQHQQALKELRKHVEDLDFDHNSKSSSLEFEVVKLNT